MNLFETITTDIAMNAQIEQKLNSHASEDRSKLLDGLDIIMRSSGVTVQEWGREMKTLWPEIDSHALTRLFTILVGDFPHLISRGSDGRYTWSHAPLDTGEELDMSDPMIHMAKAQIEYTTMIQQSMRHAQAFTPGEIIADFMSASHLNRAMATAIVQHVIDQSAASVKAAGDGSYYWEDARPNMTPGEQIAHWKNLAANGIDDPTGLL